MCYCHSAQVACYKTDILPTVNSRLKATQIIGQRKAFYRQKIPESSCVRKETVDKDILVTSRNGD